jgi:succinate dehydrogenase / fumarate reductase flavoprotein subunit
VTSDFETHAFDVVVVGAGGAGLRAAIEAARCGARTAIVCKSLLGKAHTVMAEGGIAAALGNVYPEDSWQVHFRDTMRGGKLLGDWRMAQIHAQESPERVLELEEWGALFDRTPDGRILQRDFGGHRFARLAHVGDRTGLEMIRMLQHRATQAEIAVLMECTITRLLLDGERVSGVFGYWRESGRFVVLEAPAVVLATGGVGKAYKITSNSWEYTGDGHALALWAGAELIDMEFVQFHPTGMVWPPSVRGILVTEGVRGDGGVLRNSEGERFMFRYVPPMFRAETAETEEEADRWYTDKSVRRTPDLLPRDEVARAINTEIKEGRGSPHGGVYLDIATRRDAETIKRRLPGMYHQFRELADVDITKESMEVGPTCHYMMGGVRVDAETQASTVPGLYAAGEVAGGLHGANRLGGNSLSDLLVFGRRAGQYAAEYSAGVARSRGADPAQLDELARQALRPFESVGTENPYVIQQDLQECMQALVGIIRTADELTKALEELAVLRERATRVKVEGHRQFNPGWHLALDLDPLLAVSECITRAAAERTESRGAQTREDYPDTAPELGKVNVVVQQGDAGLSLRREPREPIPPELDELLQGG